MADNSTARNLYELKERFRAYETVIRNVHPTMADSLHTDAEALITTFGSGRMTLTIPADEPVFVLRAQDRLAPQTVAAWCAAAKHNQVPKAKLDSAQEVIEAMLDWRQANHCKTPD